MLASALDRGWVARIRVTHHAGGRIVPEHALDALGGGVGAVADDHHTRVLGKADAHAAAVVEAHPGGAAGGVEQGVEQWPVRHGVGAVPHGFGFSIGAGHRARVEVIAADHDGRLQLAGLDHLVECQSGTVALAQAHPADARGQALERDPAARQVEPAMQVLVVRKQRLHLAVCLVDVLRITGQRDPAERTHATAEQRPDAGGDESRKREGVHHALFEGDLADVVAVVERGHAHLVELQHRLDVPGDGCAGGVLQALRIAGLGVLPLCHAPARWQVAIYQIVRGGLIGDEVRPHPAGASAQAQPGKHFGRVAEQPDGDGFPLAHGFADHRQGFVERGGLAVEVAGTQAEIDSALLALHREHAGAGERPGQRLRPAHPAQARREDPAAGEIAAVVLAAYLAEGFVGALDDALRADVDPGSGGHLPVHHQSLAVQLVEVVPVRPVRDQVRVGDQYARCVGMGAEHPHRLAGLDQKRFVLVQGAQSGEDLVEAFPVARSAADAAVHHQIFRPLGNFRIQVVLQHPVGGFDRPCLASQCGSARGSNHARRMRSVARWRLGSVHARFLECESLGAVGR